MLYCMHRPALRLGYPRADERTPKRDCPCMMSLVLTTILFDQSRPMQGARDLYGIMNPKIDRAGADRSHAF
jgi:hypothetical protein